MQHSKNHYIQNIYISLEFLLPTLNNFTIQYNTIQYEYVGPALVLGVSFPLRSGRTQKTVLLLLGGYTFSDILPGSDYTR